MCGVAAVYNYRDGAAVDPDELVKIRDQMAQRGPDGHGIWFSTSCHLGLAHRRLSIIDVHERSAQPMMSGDGRFVISFNGEIYNFKALRKRLRERGHHFSTGSDTEVVLACYSLWGAEMLPRLRGMYAMVIWDNVTGELFLARDPYGIKPLYYHDDGRCLRVASQVKAILAGGGVPRKVSRPGLVGFFLWGSVPEPHTIHHNIMALPAGSCMVVGGNGPRPIAEYASIPAVMQQATRSLGQEKAATAAHRVREFLVDSVVHHLVADVPVGAFLSAGIDSSVLVALMAEQQTERDHGLTAITLGFAEFSGKREDEVPLARETARRYAVRHTVQMVGREDFENDLPAILRAMDQPTVDGVNMWFVSKAAKEKGLKVAVAGLGGDELFGGYPSFHRVPHLIKIGKFLKLFGLSKPWAGSSTAARLLCLLGVHPKVSALPALAETIGGAYLLSRGLFLPHEVAQLVGAEFAADGLRSLAPRAHLDNFLQDLDVADFYRISALESSCYMRNQLLRDTDWASMAHSLEVRVPLVDWWLLKNIVVHLDTIADGRGKRVLGAAPRRPLPQGVMERKKTGFGTPIAGWMESHLATHANLAIPGNKKAAVPWARRWSLFIAAQFH